MISRIRVEARASSMEAARREIQCVLDHARLAGVLEGVVPQSSRMTDNHFGEAVLADDWNGYGMFYEGRVVLAFDPEGSPGGGLHQFGYKVMIDEPVMGTHGEDVTAESLVLHRQYPVVRDSVTDYPWVEFGGEASAEEILDNIRRLVNVKHVEVQTGKSAPWVVMVDFVDSENSLSVAHDTIREAALAAYGKCGVPVPEYRTTERSESALTEETLARLIAAAEQRGVRYRTLVVAPDRELIARRIVLAPSEQVEGVGQAVIVDPSFRRGQWMLTDEVRVEPDPDLHSR